jgi:hypothetical protein
VGSSSSQGEGKGRALKYVQEQREVAQCCGVHHVPSVWRQSSWLDVAIVGVFIMYLQCADVIYSADYSADREEN